MIWPIRAPYRTGEVPRIGSQEMLVVDPSNSLAKSIAGQTIPGEEYQFPIPERTGYLQTLTPELTRGVLYNGKPVPDIKEWAKVLVTLRRPDSTIIVHQIPALCLGWTGTKPTRRPLHYFAQGTLIDPWQSFIETPLTVAGQGVFPFRATYW